MYFRSEEIGRRNREMETGVKLKDLGLEEFFEGGRLLVYVVMKMSVGVRGIYENWFYVR